MFVDLFAQQRADGRRARLVVVAKRRQFSIALNTQILKSMFFFKKKSIRNREKKIETKHTAISYASESARKCSVHVVYKTQAVSSRRR